MKIKTKALSNTFYTIDSYGTFSTDLLDDSWFDESEFDKESFMKDLGELHCEVINEVLPAGGITSVRLLETSSPREYNFYTDQAYLEIEVDKDRLVRYLQMFDNEAQFAKFIADEFTSRDGFWSFTPNNLKDWYETMDGVSEGYDREVDRDKCIGILAGWYLTREALTEDEYLDTMYDRVHEIMWNNFEQFTTETWSEYTKYEDEFNRQKDQLEFPGFPPGHKYLMDIEEWFREVKEKEDVS